LDEEDRRTKELEREREREKCENWMMKDSSTKRKSK
jgi:hypothetical protein